MKQYKTKQYVYQKQNAGYFLFLIIEPEGVYIVCSVDSFRKEVSIIVNKCHNTIQVGTALPCLQENKINHSLWCFTIPIDLYIYLFCFL